LDKIFLDTNILVYAFDRAFPAKRERARGLIAKVLHDQNGVISTQVLQEFYVVGTKKLGLLPEVAKSALQALNSLPAVLVTPKLIQQGIDTQLRWQLSFWDAMILQAAFYARCTLIYTEDLTHGQCYRTVQVQNPFQN